MAQKTAPAGLCDRAGAKEKKNLHLHTMSFPASLQVSAVLFGDVRAAYAAMERHHDSAGIAFDRSRIAFLKARRRFLQVYSVAYGAGHV